MTRAALLIIALSLTACDRKPPTVDPATLNKAERNPRVQVTTTAPAVVVSVEAPAPHPQATVIAPDGTITAPPGHAVVIEREETTPAETRANTAEAHGGKASVFGDSIKDKTAAPPSEISTADDGNGGSSSRAKGGGIQSDQTSLMLHDGGKWGGYGLGIFLVAGGCAFLIARMFYAPLKLVPGGTAIGVGAIAAGGAICAMVWVVASPVVMAIIVGAVILGGVGFGLYSLLQGGKKIDALNVTKISTVTAIDKLKPGGAAYRDPATVAWRAWAPDIYAYLKGEVVNETDARDLPKVEKEVAAVKANL